MINVCKQCFSQCELNDIEDEYFDDEVDVKPINLEYAQIDGTVSYCCLAPVIQIDEEVLETIAMEIENTCFTFDEALEKYGDIAFYVAENLVFIQGYEEA